MSKFRKLTINFCSKSANDQFEDLFISNHGEARNNKFKKLINLIQRVPLVIPPKDVVMSLPRNHMTLENFFSSSYRGAAAIKFGQ